MSIQTDDVAPPSLLVALASRRLEGDAGLPDSSMLLLVLEIFALDDTDRIGLEGVDCVNRNGTSVADSLTQGDSTSSEKGRVILRLQGLRTTWKASPKAFAMNKCHAAHVESASFHRDRGGGRWKIESTVKFAGAARERVRLLGWPM
eukprot:CAMPEP_0173074408 /NCGR_PEP_ID=MMETSP1102-20130122/10990_1 /TAXON_ID=49646 /ORGANISM="Geminigera sp., Strain Caron Lab Isolate" /LENGTH=146 /DNA_ID=CAMNT_0013943453 /DNA_START=322 /DNA_END=764 /DNA_ORIENTATION=+